MKFVIKHDIKGNMRVHLIKKYMTYEEADKIQYYLSNQPNVTDVKVRERTCDVSITYKGRSEKSIAIIRENIIETLQRMKIESIVVPESYLYSSGREINEHFKEKLVNQVLVRVFNKFFLPRPIYVAVVVAKAIPHIKKGIKSLWHKKLEVSVLDAVAISTSLVLRDFSTAGSIIFFLNVGDTLEEWTHKKSIDDLARSMSLNVEKVWVEVAEDQFELVNVQDVKVGDKVNVHMGNVIPFDGVVANGDALVNQSSLTGESVPVHKVKGGYVYAGTVIEDGELLISVKETAGSSKYSRIVTMIEESEKLKSGIESKAEHMADNLVPFTFMGTILTWLITRNINKALAVLMVDFSCAMKFAMPVSVISAMKEASNYKITVKGGKYLEAMAEADTIVFDKTGTLTMAMPKVTEVISFDGESPDDLLRIAACLEEHFPHSMAKAVVKAAEEKNLKHDEMHSKVEYLVAHGISSKIGDIKVIIGSHHFVFEDEGCKVPEGKEELYKNLPTGCTHLYLAIDYKLAAVICVEDPIRLEATETIKKLKKLGVTKVVMMTGDSERTAREIAAKVGVDEYYSEVLPEDKATYVLKAKENGHKVIMIGDGVNDSPALSAADVGIAISDGSELAREIADITIGADNLNEIVTLRNISVSLMHRIKSNYRFIVAFNGVLIALGVGGLIQPTTSAFLHNSSTLGVTLHSMSNLLETED